MQQRKPLYKKGEHHLCENCGEFLFEIAADIFNGSPVCEAYFKGGQEFRTHELTKCKNCSHEFFSNYGLLKTIKANVTIDDSAIE